MKRKGRYTYIPKDEIAEVRTFNDVSFETDDLLDGAYVKGRKKFARGGMPSKRPMSLEEQAAESVGYDTWYSMDAVDQKELVDELVSTGMIAPMFANGGAVVEEFGSMNFRNNYDQWEMIIVSQELEKDGGRIHKHRYLVSARDINEAKKIAEGLWREDYDKSDLSIVKVMSESLYKLKYTDMYADGGMMAKGGYVAVSEKDGYLFIISKPTTKQKAQQQIDLGGLPRGEKGKVVSVEYAKAHKKVIGEEYLADGGMTGMMVLSNDEIIKDIDFEDNTDRRLGRYDFSFSTYDKQGAEILDYDGYIIESPASSRGNDEIEWGQNMPEDWETAEKILIDAFSNWKYKRYADGGMMAKGGGEIKVGNIVELENGMKAEVVRFLGKDKYNWVVVKTLEQYGGDTMTIPKDNLQKMSDGGMTGSSYAVKYSMKDTPEIVKEKIFTDKDSAELFYETISDDEDLVVMDLQEIKAAPAKKSLFATAKPAPATTAAARKKRERVEVDGIADEIARYDALKATINNAKAEQEVIGGMLKEIGREKFLDLYEQRGVRPANFDLADGNENILLEILDKYLKVEPEKAELLRQFDGLLEEKTSYEFDSELLEKEVSEGMTIGDVVSMLIQDSKLIPDSDKPNLIKAKMSMRVPKGTIDRLMDYDNPREVFSLISPILALK
jgi:hypothetical protein